MYNLHISTMNKFNIFLKYNVVSHDLLDVKYSCS